MVRMAHILTICQKNDHTVTNLIQKYTQKCQARKPTETQTTNRGVPHTQRHS